MGEPRPIKEGALPAGAPESYGGRDSIRRLIMSTRPEEFGGVADAYRSAGTLLDQTIKELTTYASRLVADGNWGGESARAMLGRMARVQSYLGTLRSQIGDIPPSVQRAARELATAKETFEQATQEQYYTVDTGSYISRELGNDPDADAQRFLAELNDRLADAHGTLPARLPWDADLASSAPYLPVPVVRDSTPGGVEFPDQESTRPVARLASVDRAASPISVTPPATASTPAIAPTSTSAALLAASVPGTATPPTLGTTPGQVPGLITSTGGTPSVATPTGYPPATGPTPTGLTAQPRRSPTGTGIRQSDGTPSDQTPSDHTRPDRTSSDPTRSVLDEGPPGTDQARTPLGGVPHETGPSVRPGVVPVVDGTWPVTRTASSGGPTGAAAGTGGMPFMPMGGGPTGYEGAPAAHRTVAPPPDDSGLFRPAYDPGQPVVD
ncbi:hypothetical protein AB0F17_21490 [Nonomuraea sp. NPDC026600]|uniref:hypothetical protein n=1 Tax=Nonomuraea sp. NPDC026600 TaxID=3155363 RepID=UPI0033CCAFAF